MRLIAILNDARTIHLEWNNLEGGNITKAEGIASTTANTEITSETKGKTKVNVKVTEPRKITGRATKKWLPYAVKEGKEDNMIRQ